jgi:hypothetical protein
MNRYETFGKQLSDLGYDVTPLNGKIPILKGWQQRPDTAKDFTKNKAASVGVVCGGKHNIVAVDIDVKHEGIVPILRTLTDSELGSAPERIGDAPKTLFVFRCSEPFKKVKTAVYDIDGKNACVEVLADGQQFVASGIHPGTKKKYKWPDDNILEIEPTSLTEITPDDINQFIITCNTALAGYGKVKSHSLTSNKPSDNSQYQFAENEQTTTPEKLLAAMAHVPNDDMHYDDWTYIAHAIKGAIGAEGSDLFHRWSKRSSKYDPQETDRLWNSIGEVKTIGAGTLYHMASQHGFDVADFDKPLGPDDIDEFDEEPTPTEAATEALPGVVDEDGCFTAESVSGPLPDREWLLDQWFPYKTTGMLFGAGGIGKTLIMQQLANCVSTGEQFMGIDTKKMPVLCVFCEDDELELKRRQLDINQWRGVDDFGSGPADCALWPRIGKDNILVTYPNQGEDKAGEFYEQLCKKVSQVKGKADNILIILDTAADMFGGNENIRREVNTFVKTYLGSIVLKYNATVILLAHPSLAGLSSGTGLSGSTAWENSVRSRAYLARMKDSDDIRTLSRKKSNYSAIGNDSDLTLIWDQGVLVIPSTPDQFDRLNAIKLKELILSEVEYAFSKGNGYRLKGDRGIYNALKIEGHKKGAVSRAAKDLIEDGNIANIKDKGLTVVEWLNKAQVNEI